MAGEPECGWWCSQEKDAEKADDAGAEEAWGAVIAAAGRLLEQIDGEKLQASLAKRMPADADDAAKKAREEEEEQAHYAESVAGSAASTQMAISGCFGAPIFNILVVLSVALLTEALHLPHGGAPLPPVCCRRVLSIHVL